MTKQHPHTHRTAAALAATAITGAGLLALTSPAHASQNTVPVVTNLRAGGHPGFDRVVIDYSAKSYGVKPTAKVRWVHNAYQCGSGKKVSLPGDRILSITLTPAQAHTDEGAEAYAGPGRLSTANIGLRTVKGVRMICDFEGYVSFAIGTTKAKGFRTGTLSNPTRFYVDITR